MSAQPQARGRRAPARVAIGVMAVALASYPLSGPWTAFGLVAPAAVRSATATTCAVGDLSGDGIGDIAVGVPGEDVGRARNAGAVNVLLGRADGSYGGGTYLTQESVGQVSETGDTFGSAVVQADVTGDGCTDLIVGSPGENSGAGQVLVAAGSATGIAGTRRIVLRQGLAGAAGRAEAGDRFGTAISVDTDYATVDRASPGLALYVGAPGEDLFGQVDAGLVTVFRASPLTTVHSTQLYQGRTGWNVVGGIVEVGDRFGAALAGGRLIGSPGEDVGSRKDAGSVYQLSHGGYRQLTQNSTGIPDVAEAGDRFGAAVSTASYYCGDNEFIGPVSEGVDVIGAPGEDKGTMADVGYVIHQGGGSENEHDGAASEKAWVLVPASGGTGARFGAALAQTDSHLLVGSPGKDVGAIADAGEVSSYPMGAGCSWDWDFSWSAWTGSRDATFPGIPETGDLFGSRLATRVGSSETALVAAPGETVAGRVAAGAVTVVDLVSRDSQELTQNTPGVPGASEPGDHFGTPAMSSG